MSASLCPDLAKLKRDLIKKIEKAKPVVLQFEKGELVSLDPAQQHMVDNYQTWVENLSYLKNGVIPPPRPVVELKKGECSDKQSADQVVPPANSSHQDPNQENATGRRKGKNTEKQHKSRSNPQPHAVKRAIAAEILGIEDVDPIIFESDSKGINALIVLLLKVNKNIKKALIDVVVKSQVNNTLLEKLQKEYNILHSLKRDIESGKIENPTVVQKSRLNLIEVIQKEIQQETRRTECQSSQYRSSILAALEKAGGGSVDSPLQSPITPPEEGEENKEGVNTSTDVILPSAGGQEEKEVKTKNNQEVSIETSTVGNMGLYDVQEGETDRVLPCNIESDNKISWASMTDTPLSEEDPDYNHPDRESDTEMRGEKENELTTESPLLPEEPTPEPSPPREIDWSDVTIIKNRPKLPKSDQKVLTNEEWETMCSREEHRPDNLSGVTSTVFTGHGSDSGGSVSGRPNTNVIPQQISPVVIEYEKVKMILSGASDRATEESSQDKSTGGILRDSVIARVQREVQFCKRNTFRNVRFIVSESSVLTWYVNVSPLEGPLTGVIVPLEIVFGNMYPQEPPHVRVKVDIIHPSIIVQTFRDSLCFEHTMPNRWSPSYGAYSILSQLQNFFSTENFRERIMQPEIKKKVRVGRGECTRYINKDINHFPFHPNPALPVFNGPFGKTTLKVSSDGSLYGPGSGTWLHAYGASGGVHRFAATITVKTDDDAFMDVGCVAPNGAIGERLGDDAYGWAFSTKTGVLKTKRKPWTEESKVLTPLGNTDDENDENLASSTDWSGKSDTSQSSSSRKQSNTSKIYSSGLQHSCIEFPLREHQVIEFTIDFDKKTLCVKVDSVVVHQDCPIPLDLESLHPSIHIPEDNIKCLLVLAIHTESLEHQDKELLKLGESPLPLTDHVLEGVLHSPCNSNNINNSFSSIETPLGKESITLGDHNDHDIATIVLQLKPVSCFVTMAGPNPRILGALVKVERNRTTFMPTSVSSANMEYICTDAYAKHRSTKLLWGRNIDAYIPLMLDKEHATNALPHLKTAITMLCRNPDATTMYVPPFKVKNVLPVMSLAMLGCIDEGESSGRPLACRLVSYGQYFHCLVALCTTEKSVKEEVLNVVNNTKNGMVLQSPMSSLVLMHLCPILITTDLNTTEVTNLTWDTSVKIAIASFCVSQVGGNDRKEPLSSNLSDVHLSKLYDELSNDKRRLLARAVLFSKVVYRSINRDNSIITEETTDHNNSINTCYCFTSEDCFESLCRHPTTIPPIDLLWGERRIHQGLPVTFMGLIDMLNE